MKNQNFVMFILLLLISQCYSFFDDIGMGARQTAMANAFTAVSDDVYSLYYNPAGLVKIEGGNLGVMYAQLWPFISGEGLSDMFLGINMPARGNIGIGGAWQTRRLEGVVIADTFSFGIGKKLKENIWIGLTAKYLRFELVSSEIKTIPELKDHSSKSAFGIDFGMLLNLQQKIDIGFSIKNLNQPDIGLFESAPVPMVIKAGISKKIVNNVLLAMDVSNSSVLTEFSVGSEIVPNENITFRGGVLTSNTNCSKICLGIGVKINKLQLDYSYVIQLLGGTGNDAGTHRVSLNLKLK